MIWNETSESSRLCTVCANVGLLLLYFLHTWINDLDDLPTLLMYECNDGEKAGRVGHRSSSLRSQLEREINYRGRGLWEICQRCIYFLPWHKQNTQIDTHVCSSSCLLLSTCISLMPLYYKTLSWGQHRHKKPCSLYNHINSLAGMRKPCLSHSLSCLGRVCNILK